MPKSINYFENLYSINQNIKQVIKYPLIQLYNYLGEIEKSRDLEMYNFQSSYFPISAFVVLPENWKTNYSINVIVDTSELSVSGIESAVFSINVYSKYLRALDESSLRDTLSTKIYRFTYLRSFDYPIVIRIENENDTISIHWKVLDNRADDYASAKIIENESKELTMADWELIENKIEKIDFWNLSTVDTEFIGFDGSRWILEGKALGKYSVASRWCGKDISSVCKKLIELTALKFKKGGVY